MSSCQSQPDIEMKNDEPIHDNMHKVKQINNLDKCFIMNHEELKEARSSNHIFG